MADPYVKPATAVTAPTVAELQEQLRERDARIERLEAMVASIATSSEKTGQTSERLAKLVETLLASGANVVSVAGPAPAPATNHGPTFAELWTDYLVSLGEVSWKVGMVGLMNRVLAWFAPSVCRRRYVEDPDIDPRCVLRTPGKPPKMLVAGPDIRVEDLHAEQWEAFRAWLQRPKGPQLDVSTLKQMLTRTLVILNWARRRKRIPSHDLGDVARGPGKAKRKTKLTDDYLERLRPHATRLTWAYALTICDAGTRPGEARLLLWAQVDDATPIVTDDTETWEFELLPWQVKGKRKSRFGYFTRRCLDAYAAIPRIKGNPFVFGSRKTRGEAYSRSVMWRAYREAADAAGLEPYGGDGSVHAHDGRRAYASKLINADVTLPKVQELLGHSDIATTMKYVDVDTRTLRTAHAKLATAKRKPPHRADGE